MKLSDLTLILTRSAGLVRLAVPPASCLAGAARRLRERLGEAAPEA